MISGDFRINGRLENGTVLLQILAKLQGIDKISVMRRRQGSLDVIKNQGCAFFTSCLHPP